MRLTTTQLCQGRGWSQAGTDYSFKHAFSWPSTTATPAGEAASAAHMAAGGIPPGGPHGPMTYQFSGRGGWPGPRRFGGRRFIWFALGVGAATIYFRRKHHHLEIERAAQDGPTAPQIPAGRGCDNAWRRRWEISAPQSPQPVAAVNEGLSAQQSGAPWAGDQWRRAHDASASVSPTLAASIPVQSSVMSAIPQEVNYGAKNSDDEKQQPQRNWGWGAHRRQRREQRAAAGEAARSEENTKAEPRVDQLPHVSMAADNEEQQLREYVESLWAEKKKHAAEAQALEEQKTKQQTRERLDKLSRTIDAFRESLKAEETASERKLV